MPLPTEQPPKWYIYHICCDLHFDLLTPNSNKFMYVPRHTSNNSLEKIHQHILELSQTQTPKIAFFSHIYIFTYLVMLWPTSDFLNQQRYQLSLTQDGLPAKVWWKSINSHHGYRRNNTPDKHTHRFSAENSHSTPIPPNRTLKFYDFP